VTAAHLGDPVAEDDIALVEALLDRSLPADLLAWWRQSCGATGSVEGRLIPPGHTPYTIDQAVDHRELMLAIASCEDAMETAALVAEPAGSPCSPCWLPVWLPIAQDGGGNNLFIDLRQGPMHGCVMEWDKYEKALGEPLWPTVAAMLAEIADAVEHGTDIEGYQPHACNDGTLDWI
jgi:cell wall assembly regulator SMI1